MKPGVNSDGCSNASDSTERGGGSAAAGRRRAGYPENDRRAGGASGGRGRGGGAVKTMIAFHQVGPIFYSSLKQSNLQKDNYALAPFYLLEESGAGA